MVVRRGRRGSTSRRSSRGRDQGTCELVALATGEGLVAVADFAAGSMFYSQYVLTRRGPLAKIWLAAHMQSKLSKSTVFSVDLVKACEKIMHPDAPMALRLTGSLLLGVVRVFYRKTDYLLSDCSEAVSKIRLAFRVVKAPVDLPDESSTAQYGQITLEETAGRKSTGLESEEMTIRGFPNIQLEALLPMEVAGALQAAEVDITLAPSDVLGLTAEFDAGEAIGGLTEESPMSVELARHTAAEEPEGPNLTEPLSELETPELARRATVEPFSASAQDITLEVPALEQADRPEPLSDVAAEQAMDVDALRNVGEITFDEEEEDAGEPFVPLPQDVPPVEVAVAEPRPKRRRRAVSSRYDRETTVPAARMRANMRNTADLLRASRKRRGAPSTEPLALLRRSSLLVPTGTLGEFFADRMDAAMAAAVVEDSSGGAIPSRRPPLVAHGRATAATTPQPAGRSTPQSLPDSVEVARNAPAHGTVAVASPRLSLADEGLRSAERRDEPPQQEIELSPVEIEYAPMPMPTDESAAAAPETPRAQASMTLSEVAAIDNEPTEAENKRRDKLEQLLQAEFADRGPEVNYSQMLLTEKTRSAPSIRRTAARTFAELLNLASAGTIGLAQHAPYGDILITSAA